MWKKRARAAMSILDRNASSGIEQIRKYDLAEAEKTWTSNPSLHSYHDRQYWNSPMINTYRIGLTFFAFFNFGLNDAIYGVRV